MKSQMVNQSLADDSPVEEIVNRLVQVSAVLTSSAPLRERMENLCEVAVSILSCDRTTILRWDGERYRALSSYGLPDHLIPYFHSQDASDLLVSLIDGVEDFIVFDRSSRDLVAGDVSMGAEAVAICPVSGPNGIPLAVLTAGFYENPDRFDDVQTQVLMGLASLIRVALVTDLDREASLKSLASRRELRLEMDQSEQESRRRISQEIHNDSMTKLSSLHDSIKRLAAETQDESIRATLEALTDESAAAVNSLGNMFASFDPQCPNESTLVEALLSTLRSFAIRTGWRTDFVNNLTTVPPVAIQSELLQIARQALANADLHSGAHTIWTELRTVEDGTQLTISDDGSGFESSEVPANRFGLLSMHERAENAGGTFVLASKIGVGTVISAWIPNR